MSSLRILHYVLLSRGQSVVDKPLIRVLPELHEDTDDYLLNYQGIPSSTSQKYSLQKHDKQQSKNDILNQQFNLK